MEKYKACKVKHIFSEELYFFTVYPGKKDLTEKKNWNLNKCSKQMKSGSVGCGGGVL